MSMKRIPTILLSAGVLLAAGCATDINQAPAIAEHPKSEQKVMEAAHHWDLLAQYEAARILDAVKDKSKPLYVVVQEGQVSPFKRDYHHFLRKHLVGEGGTVVTKPLSGAANIEYFVEVVRHKDRGKWAPEPSDGNPWPGHDIVRPTEVVITTRVLEGNLVLMSDSHAFYHNPGDVDHYVDDAVVLLKGPTFPVVDQ